MMTPRRYVRFASLLLPACLVMLPGIDAAATDPFAIQVKTPCTKVPDVTGPGSSLSKAIAALEKCGLTVGGIDVQQPPTPEQAGQIYKQEPAAGSPISVAPRGAVRLTRYDSAINVALSGATSDFVGQFTGAQTITGKTPLADGSIPSHRVPFRISIEQRGTQWYVLATHEGTPRNLWFCAKLGNSGRGSRQITLEELTGEAGPPPAPPQPILATMEGDTLYFGCPDSPSRYSIKVNGDDLSGSYPSDINTIVLRGTRVK